MKRYLLLLLLLPFTSVGRAQTFTMNEGGTTSKNYYEEIPYQTVNGKIFIDVTVAGKKHRFLFDTGAPVTISKELAAELHASLKQKVSFADVNQSADSTAVVLLNDIQLGNTTFNHIPAITLFPDFYKCMGIDGVIGSNLLRKSIVSISAAKHTIIITDQLNKLDLHSKNSGPLIVSAQQSDPAIVIVLKNKLRLTIPFDSGDNGLLRMSDDMLDRFSKLGVFDTLATGYGASTFGAGGLQKSAQKHLVKVPFLTVANARFEGVVAETNKGVIPGIGAKLLDYGTLTLDFIHSKFYFEAIDANNVIDAGQWPFKPTMLNDKLVIGVVWGDAHPLLKPGRQIVAVDDADYSQITFCQMLNAKPILEGKQNVVLTIKDEQGNLLKVPMSKK